VLLGIKANQLMLCKEIVVYFEVVQSFDVEAGEVCTRLQRATLIRRINGRSLGTFKGVLFQVFGERLTEKYF
jgi:hypothetical protein